jgi:hypothetical protein
VTKKKDQPELRIEDPCTTETSSKRRSDEPLRRRGGHNHDVRIVIRPVGKDRFDALTPLIDCWLARELARQIARDLIAAKEVMPEFNALGGRN